MSRKKSICLLERKGGVSVDPRPKGLYGQNGKPAWRVSEVANVSAGLVPVGPCLAASSLCHASRCHEGLSPWSDDYQPARHGSTETSHRGGPGPTSLLSGYQSPFPGDKLPGGDAAGEGQQAK